MFNKNLFKTCALIGATAAVCMLGACGRPAPEEEPESMTQELTQTDATAETDVTVVTSESTTGTTTQTQKPSTSIADPAGVSYEPPIVINQRTTSFGDMGCGGAAALMALQALGMNTDIDTDAQYASFWKTVPKSYNPTRGWNNNTGIWNPAYCEWLSGYANVKRLQNYTTNDIKDALSGGSVVIPLVALGDNRLNTHWFVVYGWYEDDGVTFFNVADPWGGGLREYTGAKLKERIEEAGERKGKLGFGYETEAVVVSRR